MTILTRKIFYTESPVIIGWVYFWEFLLSNKKIDIEKNA